MWAIAALAGCIGSPKVCGERLSDEELDAQTAVLRSGAQALNRVIDLGGEVDRLSAALFDLPHAYWVDGVNVAVPSGFAYDDAGGYAFTSVGTGTVRFLYGDDYAVGAEDEVVVPNLFDPDNYLVDLSYAFDLVENDIVIDYAEPGPLVELLGQGADPPNPLHLDYDQAADPYWIGRLKVTVEGRVAAGVTYDVTGGPVRIKPFTRATDTLPVTVSGLAGAGADGAALTGETSTLAFTAGADPTVITTMWGMEPTPGTAEGAVPFELRGGMLDVDGTYTFDGTNRAHTQWDCAAP